MPKLFLLFYITLVLSLVIASDAKVFDSTHQVSHNRFLKKRAPAPQLGGLGGPQPVNGVGADPSTATTPAATQSTPTATTASSTPVSSVSSSSSATAVNKQLKLLQSVSQVLPTTATTSLTSSSTSSSSSTSPTSTQSTPFATTATPAQAGSPASQPVCYTHPTLSSSSTGITHTALIVLIVIATSVGGSIIIWTIIRKWKFGKSSSFDDRMQPIDWQPSNDNDDNGGIPCPIPDHDFTAGPANLAPVGGYADLARGPSPQPMMQELARGPSFNARQYQSDQYGVPLHHGGYATHGY
ncbi:hypothetical protein EDD22DRAFT_995998 [Suillus occidentalis]|nr:hypothetical protein EDD22DRAFT_995998 [Suillus occidentalis]